MAQSHPPTLPPYSANSPNSENSSRSRFCLTSTLRYRIVTNVKKCAQPSAFSKLKPLESSPNKRETPAQRKRVLFSAYLCVSALSLFLPSKPEGSEHRNRSFLSN